MVNKQVFLETYHYFDKSVIVEIIDIFLDEYQGKLEKLYNDVKSRDFTGLRFTAHNLKGVVANFSAPTLLEMVKNFEKSAAELVEHGGAGFDEAAAMQVIDNIRASLLEMAGDLSKIRAELVQEG
ncbi:hypothetical protein SDC9_15552 [bioreactor metagenome]|jgi:HPt (histidine-containing phosphotransfer) domain-containing protein|uniref:HPt domain-containing protein n=1 Tax=bioreactor metagenome TaxID=1076179 RepID=A0A644TS60_9ZZZZ|nr:Hpt domain-containing protein [Lentimicrobium sp.]MEA5111190.1 Hpt domain-containing protein [Lentimicrobium sp.]